jgi:hypothetical protein
MRNAELLIKVFKKQKIGVGREEKNNGREKDESRRLEAHEDELFFEGRYYFMVILPLPAGRVTA